MFDRKKCSWLALNGIFIWNILGPHICILDYVVSNEL